MGMSRIHGATQLQSPEMGDQKLQHEIPNQSPDGGTVASKRVEIQRHSNKQNLDYVLRSGLCGGLAGCAVCTFSIPEDTSTLMILPGQDSCRTPRSCQDPVPGLQPSIRQIHWFLVRRRDRHARHQSSRWSTRPFPRPLGNPPPYLPLCRNQIRCL